MSDFLDLLEGELVDAARRRRDADTAASRDPRAWLQWVRAHAFAPAGPSGRWVGAVAALAVAVAVVVTIAAAHGAPLRAAAPASPGSPRSSTLAATPCGSTPERSSADPDTAVGDLLAGDRAAAPGLRARAVSTVARSAIAPSVVYVRSARVVRGPSGTQVVLVAVRRCHRPRNPGDALVAVLASGPSLRPAALDLGTPARIAARRTFALAASADGAERIAVVPAGVRVVICSARRGGRTYRFVVRHRLLIVQGPTPALDCRA